MLFDHLPIADRLALLDPGAYDYYFSTAWDITVPAGETWYAVNVWWARLNGANDFFHRTLDCREPFIMPAGTRLQAAGTGHAAFAYICKPAKVTPPADPEGVLTARLASLRTLPLSVLRQVVYAGAPNTPVLPPFWDGDNPTANFAKGLLRHISAHDISWLCLTGPSRPDLPGAVNTLNTLVEIGDADHMRFTGNVLLPFDTQRWTGIAIQGHSPYTGIGIATYNRLPADW